MPLIADITFTNSVNPTVFLVVLAFWLGLRLIKDRLDRTRITDYVKESDGTIIRISWSPLGRGWFGEKSDRIYEVTYRTSKGKTVTSTCKTSMFTGVYWTDGPAPVAKPEPQTIQCLSCGTTIPKRRESCPKCGWSYEQPETKSRSA